MAKKLDPYKIYHPEDFTLLDDGTMDRVVLLPGGQEWRYSDTGDCRDFDGTLNFEDWIYNVVIPDMDSDPDLWES